MGWPGGRWLVGLAGLTVVGAGVVFLVNAWKEKYREHLQANRFTRDWNWLLKAGVVAHGVVTALIGILFVQAAWRVDPKKAGGIGKAFSWLVNQPYGQVLVAAICVGLIASPYSASSTPAIGSFPRCPAAISRPSQPGWYRK